MSDIIEILGEKKFSGSRSSDLKSSIVLEETTQTQYDNNLFYTISFLLQKGNFFSKKYNIDGKYKIIHWDVKV